MTKWWVVTLSGPRSQACRSRFGRRRVRRSRFSGREWSITCLYYVLAFLTTVAVLSMIIPLIGHAFARPASSSILRASCVRWKSMAATQDGPVVSETNRRTFHRRVRTIILTSFLGTEATMKRFWKDVGIERRQNMLAITLDKHALKTPSGNTLLLPTNKSLVASLIAAEWDHQETLLKPHALPMVTQSCLV